MARLSRFLLAGLILLPLSAVIPTGASAQSEAVQVPQASDIVDRFYRGRAVINSAVQAAGGVQAVRGLNGLSYALEGEIFNDIQGHSATRIGNPARDGRQRITSRIDWAGPRFAQTVFQYFDSGYNSAFATIWRDGSAISPRWVPRDYSQTDSAPSPFQPGGPVMISSRWLPPVILKRALQNGRSAFWIGQGAIAGEPVDVVDFTFDESTRFRLHVSRTSHLIRRVETIAPDPISADDATIADLSGDQVVGGLHFPERIRASRRGFVNQDFTLSAVAVNPVFAAADFNPPEGFSRLPDSPPQVRTAQVAGRVYEVSGLAGGTYQVPFVVMDDFVVAYEAPLGIAQTRQVIAEIRKVAGEKPIRYVVISHFHADHAGGVGAYVEEGVTVVSSAGNRTVLEAYARGNRPQSQGLEGVKPNLMMKFMAVPASGLVLKDAKGSRLEIVDFAGNSHAENMVALFDPEARVFMGADHFIDAVTWNPTFENVARWVRRNRGVDLMVGTHIRPVARKDYLARAAGPHRRLD
jgi:glyoxylase-like metal-dependent hydrolase (beta-lactamase superfamily II)